MCCVSSVDLNMLLLNSMVVGCRNVVFCGSVCCMFLSVLSVVIWWLRNVVRWCVMLVFCVYGRLSCVRLICVWFIGCVVVLICGKKFLRIVCVSFVCVSFVWIELLISFELWFGMMSGIVLVVGLDSSVFLVEWYV